MHVIVLAPGPWKIIAELEERDGRACSLLDDLAELGPNFARSRAGLIAALLMVAKEGPKNMPWIEPASSTDPRVYKFVKGSLRLYFCYGDGCVLVCSSCAVKKTQKTERKLVAAAVELHGRYKKAIADKSIKEFQEYGRIQKV